MTHPGAAVLADEQARNRVLRQIDTEQQTLALLLERELRSMKASRRGTMERDGALAGPPRDQSFCETTDGNDSTRPDRATLRQADRSATWRKLR
jgi:hypothetical protein